MSELKKVVYTKRQARQQANKLSTTQQFLTEIDVVECFKELPEYQSNLAKYGAGNFVTCFEKVV